jgi:hypothetical protein
MKICSQCKLDLPVSSFWKDKTKLRSYCKECDKARRQRILDQDPDYFAAKTARSVAKRRAWLKEYKESTPCADCGVSYPHYVMDLDHRWDEEKAFTVGQATGLKKMKAEVAKCDLVCSNCHRIRTNNILWKPMRKGLREYAAKPRKIGRPYSAQQEAR